MILEVPILYSFRRCPYAIRARMAIFMAGITCELREVLLSDKPDELIEISPKATVPVLCLGSKVIDESLDIIKWSRSLNDQLLLTDKKSQSHALEIINIFDTKFKLNLDKYKYPDPKKHDSLNNRQICLDILRNMDHYFISDLWFYGDRPSLLDIAILPFIRQYRSIDTDWFDKLSDIPNVKKCLNHFLQSKELESVMRKYDQWRSGSNPVYFP
jgi:glutathione S-transferase